MPEELRSPVADGAPPMVLLEGVSWTQRPHFWRPARTLLRAVSCQVAAGAAFGLLGPNGAGKTTTIKVVLGLLRPQRGRVRVAGAAAGSRTACAHIGFVPERAELPGYTDARTYVVQHALWAGQGFRAARRSADAALDRVGLASARGRLARFSKGMQQRVSLAQALVASPSLLVLDEPTSGLDPRGRAELRAILARLHAEGTTLLICTHALPDVPELCDSVGILVDGSMRVAGPLAPLLAAASGPLYLEATQVSAAALAAAAPLSAGAPGVVVSAPAAPLSAGAPGVVVPASAAQRAAGAPGVAGVHRFAAADLAAANALADLLRHHGAVLRALGPSAAPIERLYARALEAA